VRNPRNPQEGPIAGRGAYQVMALLAPFLVGESRELVETLSREYLPA